MMQHRNNEEHNGELLEAAYCFHMSIIRTSSVRGMYIKVTA